MAAIVVTLDADHLLRALSQARHKIQDKALMTSISLSLLKNNEERHIAHQAPDGTQWEKLKPYTLLHKTNPRWLVEHGDMLRFYSRATSKTIMVGSADKKAYWHHHGTKHDSDKGPVRRLPARPLVGFPDSDRQFTLDLIGDHLRTIL